MRPEYIIWTAFAKVPGEVGCSAQAQHSGLRGLDRVQQSLHPDIQIRTCAWVIDSGAPFRTVNAISPPRPSSAANSACTRGDRVLDQKIGKP